MHRISLRFSQLLCLALLFSLAAAAPASEPMERSFTARVSVDETGQVTATEIRGEVPEALETVVRQAAAQVAFEPARRAGVPVPSRTSLTLKVRFEPVGGRYAAKVVDVTGGRAALLGDGRVPYPRAGARSRYSAIISTQVLTDPQGRVDMDRSSVESVRLFRDGKEAEGGLEGTREAFAEVVRKAMADWEFALEEVDGQPVHTRFRVPVTFCVERRGAGQCASFGADPAQDRPAPLDDRIQLARPKA